jgi:RNase P/RNase MRP subunit p29
MYIERFTERNADLALLLLIKHGIDGFVAESVLKDMLYSEEEYDIIVEKNGRKFHFQNWLGFIYCYITIGGETFVYQIIK